MDVVDDDEDEDVDVDMDMDVDSARVVPCRVVYFYCPMSFLRSVSSGSQL
jgi:hypothetical protein